jgi:hypothetical protein
MSRRRPERSGRRVGRRAPRRTPPATLASSTRTVVRDGMKLHWSQEETDRRRPGGARSAPARVSRHAEHSAETRAARGWRWPEWHRRTWRQVRGTPAPPRPSRAAIPFRRNAARAAGRRACGTKCDQGAVTSGWGTRHPSTYVNGTAGRGISAAIAAGMRAHCLGHSTVWKSIRESRSPVKESGQPNSTLLAAHARSATRLGAAGSPRRAPSASRAVRWTDAADRLAAGKPWRS